jgi:hypothetical protein
MNRKWIFCVALGALLSRPAMIGAQGAPADAPPPPPPPHGGMLPGGPFGPRMKVLGFEEMHPGKVVTGAPFSAVAVIENTQTLSNGTTINRKTQISTFRDSQGRVRRETTLPAMGPLTASGQSKTFILIHDPVAGTAFELKPDKKEAVQLPGHPAGKKNPDALQNKFEQHIQQEIASGTLQKEDLGTQTINGIAAQGTRYTRTIPLGQIGNDKPISIVSERWYSPDLQIVVKSTRNDPRFGSTTYTVTNIQRQEQAGSLFAVPADYTVTQGHGPREHKGSKMPEPPPDAPPPPNEQ